MARAKDKLKNNPDKLRLLVAGDGLKLNYKDLKRKAIILGMPFPEATGCSIFNLVSYIKHSDAKPDLSLIDKYDKWIDEHFNEVGVPADDPIRSSRLRLGYLGDEDSEGGKKRRSIKGIPKSKIKKPKKEKDEDGHIKGTKKSYTWECAKKGFDLDRTKRRVLKKFPDANEKSIQLWYRAAKRSLNK